MLLAYFDSHSRHRDDKLFVEFFAEVVDVDIKLVAMLSKCIASPKFIHKIRLADSLAFFFDNESKDIKFRLRQVHGCTIFGDFVFIEDDLDVASDDGVRCLCSFDECVDTPR